MGKYKCLCCNGEGQIIVSGPEYRDYIADCTHCGGTGLKQITISLKEFEQIAKGIRRGDSCNETTTK